MWRKQARIMFLFLCGVMVVFGTGNAGPFFAGLTAQDQGSEDSSPPPRKNAVGQGGDRKADTQAITALSKEFVKTFNSGDAKAVAGFWTKNGEYHSELGESIQGRTNLAKAYGEFFKENPGAKLVISINDIRFPSSATAVEEGTLRVIKNQAELPRSTNYSVVHALENGKWQMAVVVEWGAGQDRLQDLDWLLGSWSAKTKEREMALSFAKDKSMPFVIGKFSVKDKGKVTTSGTMKIGIDPQNGQLRSWHFDDDGGHGQALWIRDGNSWVMDSLGVMANGAELASVNILTRLDQDSFLWRSIDRVADGEALPDTIPVKLTRIQGQR